MPLLKWLFAAHSKRRPSATPIHPNVGAPLRPTLLEQLREDYPLDEFTIPDFHIPGAQCVEIKAAAEAVAHPESHNQMSDPIQTAETAVEAAAANVVRGAVALFDDAKAFLAKNVTISPSQSASATQALAAAEGAVGTIVETAADDGLAYLLAKVPGGTLEAATAQAYLNRVLEKLGAYIVKAS